MNDTGKKKIETVGVIGTGTMGQGIIQITAVGGMTVLAYDEKPGAADAAKSKIIGFLDRAVSKERMTAEDARAASERIVVTKSLTDLAEADLVVEAIIEDLEAKKALFKKLEGVVRADAILASNTSSLSITGIATACDRPERVAGLHFFNPVPLMKLVEVIPGIRTDDAVVDSLMNVGDRMGRSPVLCADSPGFLVNHLGRGYMPEALRILEEGIATHSDIDRIMTGAPGFRMGPITLVDLVGADVASPVMNAIYDQYFHEPAYRPSQMLNLRREGGILGRKSGRGFYEYPDGKKIEPDVATTPDTLPPRVRIISDDASGTAELQALIASAKVEIDNDTKGEVLTLLPLVGSDLSTTIAREKYDPARTVGVDTLFGLDGVRTLMITPATAPEIRAQAHALLGADGAQVAVINDSPGFVAQRLAAVIVNIACHIAQRGIASPKDIDKGARLGLNYPKGPFELARDIEPARICQILCALEAFYGEPRYRPAAWLRRRVNLGLPLETPDAEL